MVAIGGQHGFAVRLQLTDEQLEAINHHIEARSRRYAAEDDLPESPTVSVRFDFWVLGRDVTVYFEGVST